MVGADTNMTSIKVSSDGAWQGENPLKYAFPLLIIQTTMVLLLSRTLAFLLKPLRQPKVIAEIIGGILLGPSALGRCEAYLHAVFPSWSLPILDTVSSIGLLFFLFLVGLELELDSIRRSGRRAFGIAAAGILLPFVSGVGIVLVLRKTVPGADEVSFFRFLIFIGVALSITAFPVLARILAELKLLTTAVGETAMAAAAFNDVAAWILLALAVALSGGGEAKSPLVSLWVLLSGILFVIFMMTAVRPVMGWVARHSSPENRPVEEACICLTLMGVLLSGLMTDLIGIHSIFGAFVFGLTIPKEGEFAGRLFERIEDFVSGLLLPLYFASSGLKTDVGKIHGAEAWGLLVLVIATACMGKILGTFLVAVSHKIPAREAVTLGVLMGTKGLVELIVLNIGKEKKVLNDETFAILVLMALFTTFMTTPTVMAIYKPNGGGSSHYRRRKLQLDSSMSASSSGRMSKELRILTCLYGPKNVPATINLMEMIRGTEKSRRLKLYIMQLIELTDRPSSILMAQRVRKNGRPSQNPPRMGGRDRVIGAFEAYGQVGRVKIRTIMAISALATMDEDVCGVAEEKRVALLVLPFHKHGKGEGDVVMENVGPEWRGVNQRVLANAPCSVGVLVDRGFGGASEMGPRKGVHGVCVLFFGGPDDREALELGAMMVDNSHVEVTVKRFVVEDGANGHRVVPLPTLEGMAASCNVSTPGYAGNWKKEKELDEEALEEFRNTRGVYVGYEEKTITNSVEEVMAIGRSGDYELVVVGRRTFHLTPELAENTEGLEEHSELGLMGSFLASQGQGVVASVLVIQQHNHVHSCDYSSKEKNQEDAEDVGAPV